MQLKIYEWDEVEQDYTEHDFVIQFRHVREWKRNKTSGKLEINPKGGVTILASTNLKHPLPRIYPARCHTDDLYCKREGIYRTVEALIHDFLGYDWDILYFGTADGGRVLEVTATQEKAYTSN
jgi:hypothetical protein